ncbi:hypothetical protein BJY16_003896 [Actinoplanes octamycinicus]|uniref:Uncharacterized protein n=1 Tax=Actinoplanes octamycinicus TaxID=135948 RepID=A0A7W7GYF3_9ACTN|nr:hypothetical protein [Actinoplanes octamycinicus]MBB4740437.1 hypothetical protein [Actinoplanes octamycinicus]GIE59697.1 hypothetical protein Aoc01nite_50990 [Actinoplanes octamycinicus]
MRSRIAPTVGLFFLAPLVAEFLLGNLPITFLPAVLALAPLYGGGALLIREVVRRRGRGWPNILILAVAYGVLEEGLTTQSLFNPNYADQHLLVDGFLPALGIAVPWTVYVIGIHVFWSVCAPIMMMEVISGARRTTPWLGRAGLIVTGVLFLAGCGISVVITMSTWPYTATPGQFLTTSIVLVLLIAAGLLVRIGFRPRPGVAPSALVVLIATLVAGAVFQGLTLDVLHVPAALAVAVWVLDVAVYLTLLAHWSARAGWTDLHRLAIAAGALLTYAWHSFVETPVGAAAAAVDLIGNAIFTAGAVTLIWYAYRKVTARAAPAGISGVHDDRSVG